MKTYDIVTLTVNPALDKSAHFRGLAPDQKIRCEAPRYDAGGGGVNVSKAIARLGGESLCVFTSGGSSGQLLKDLIATESIAAHPIETKSWTRESFVAVDDNTNSQYRFGFPGALITEAEKDEIIASISKLKTKYLVISGSLNESLELNFYQLIARLAKAAGAMVIVDTSGKALEMVLQEGVYLAKPNVGELAKLIGVERLEMGEVADAARQLIDKGSAEIVVVSLGAQGAVLVTKEQTEFVTAPNVARKSTVGAGDSMV
ncbi:MAG TPA: 1-phosphofructokinase family hexose kinase, partial [Flavobacterium sp.]|nr:1-phosphofructokinase family hexose kinase [Flavobacterium sp.]